MSNIIQDISAIHINIMESIEDPVSFALQPASNQNHVIQILGLYVHPHILYVFEKKVRDLNTFVDSIRGKVSRNHKRGSSTSSSTSLATEPIDSESDHGNGQHDWDMRMKI